jgi:hypothetical protein
MQLLCHTPWGLSRDLFAYLQNPNHAKDNQHSKHNPPAKEHSEAEGGEGVHLVVVLRFVTFNRVDAENHFHDDVKGGASASIGVESHASAWGDL